MATMNSLLKKGDDTNYDFEVGRERLILKNGQDTGFDALYRKDTGSALSIVTPKYKLTPHKTANEFVEKLLNTQNIAFDYGKTAVTAGGNRFFREFRFPSMKFVPGGPNNTALDGGRLDEYIPTIIVRNSYDRSSTLDFVYGGYRLVCSNGLISGKTIQRIQVKHIISPDFSKIGDTLVDRLEMTIEDFKRTYEVLNTEPANIYLQVLMMEVLTKRMAMALTAMSSGLVQLHFDADGNIENVTASKQLSAYALLQLATNVATHQVRKFHRSLELQKRIANVFEA
jgi:hypothetical protein